MVGNRDACRPEFSRHGEGVNAAKENVVILGASAFLYVASIVFGMMRAFDEIAQSETSVAPAELANSISSSYLPNAYVLGLAAVGVVVLAVGAFKMMASDKGPAENGEPEDADASS